MAASVLLWTANGQRAGRFRPRFHCCLRPARCSRDRSGGVAPSIIADATVLGWSPTVPLRAGMRLTMRAFMEEIGQPQPAKPARAAVRLEGPAAAAG